MKQINERNYVMNEVEISTEQEDKCSQIKPFK